ncbi:GNAT family N-acetyltransferase [Streptomyces sp. NPDC058701]|uniref:GNAT family N-acetyltransferase n=1 Tax=Streptomyces sp. NPDC058701 TaxID=3346608 RepID=UPI003660298C
MLTTARLRVRHFRPDDAPVFAEYRSVPAVARYQDWTPPITLQRAAAMVADFAKASPLEPGRFCWAVELAATGALIGDVEVHLQDNLLQSEVTCTLALPHQGLGYATEAMTAVLAHGFTVLELKKVSARCDARSITAARFLERVGFQLEGRLRAHRLAKGEWTDDLLYGLLLSDWRRSR